MGSGGECGCEGEGTEEDEGRVGGKQRVVGKREDEEELVLKILSAGKRIVLRMGIIDCCGRGGGV